MLPLIRHSIHYLRRFFVTHTVFTPEISIKPPSLNMCSLIHPKRVMSRGGYRISLRVATVILIAFFAAACMTQAKAESNLRAIPDYLASDELQAAKVYRKVLPTVVTIYTSKKVLQHGGQVEQGGIGSGVLISAECHVLTAAHVVKGADEISVKTHDGKLQPAELLFSETSADIALIKLITPDPELEYAELGNSDQLAVGQMAYAIGSPYGLENSFSVGHISGFRDFDRFYDGTIRAKFIQTDAAINLSLIHI